MVQVEFVVLFALGHPAQAIVAAIAAQTCVFFLTRMLILRSCRMRVADAIVHARASALQGLAPTLTIICVALGIASKPVAYE